MKRFILSLAALLAASVANAADLRVVLPDRGTFVIEKPSGWVERVSRLQPELPPTISLSPREGRAFVVLVTPMWAIPSAPFPKTDGEVKKMVTDSMAQVKAQAVEKSIPIREIRGAAGSGYYFSVTDRAPGPNEYKYLTQGMLAHGDIRVGFSFLSNDSGAAAPTRALEIIKAAKVESL